MEVGVQLAHEVVAHEPNDGVHFIDLARTTVVARKAASLAAQVLLQRAWLLW